MRHVLSEMYDHNPQDRAVITIRQHKNHGYSSRSTPFVKMLLYFILFDSSDEMMKGDLQASASYASPDQKKNIEQQLWSDFRLPSMHGPKTDLNEVGSGALKAYWYSFLPKPNEVLRFEHDCCVDGPRAKTRSVRHSQHSVLRTVRSTGSLQYPWRTDPHPSGSSFRIGASVAIKIYSRRWNTYVYVHTHTHTHT
jgi:hypothetical protein